jgi:hypothetical protein
MSDFGRRVQNHAHAHPFNYSLALPLEKVSKGDMLNAHTYESIEDIEHALLRGHLMNVDLNQRSFAGSAQ